MLALAGAAERSGLVSTLDNRIRAAEPALPWTRYLI